MELEKKVRETLDDDQLSPEEKLDRISRLMPKDSLADIGWKHSWHYLAGATLSDGTKVVMLTLHNRFGSGPNPVVCQVDREDGSSYLRVEEQGRIFPNGVVYSLVESGRTPGRVAAAFSRVMAGKGPQEVGPVTLIKSAELNRRTPKEVMTVAECENLPLLSVVSMDEQTPWTKLGRNSWSSKTGTRSNEAMSGSYRSVLREGKSVQ